MRRIGLVFLVSLGCVAVGGDDPSSGHSDVGGKPESGYPFAGYLFSGTSPADLAFAPCSATLIRKNAAITAAHCLSLSEQRGKSTYAIGFAALGSSSYAVKQAIPHPKYREDPNAPFDHDVAILLLEGTPDGIPLAEIGPATADATMLTVGYGQTQVDDPGKDPFQHVGERRRVIEHIVELTDLHIMTEGIDGQPCGGDSGSALIVPDTNQIAGVLAGSYDETCDTGGHDFYASLAGNMDFIQSTLGEK